ncbi:hypothetical protein [Kribbella sindirgiensis]|uniref:Uncharacterized protein n=1 Tax=Kribbella sindirgiensis TaxID=1124744 RepID=A0A4R0I266_9ACTN|nr:hypothetical protein [Kribbella sindirgiensis]TCC19974.1 hypothetical protein E0H50_37760 [Kribbella sindirgiensis]
MTASVDILAGGIRQTFTNQDMGWAVAFEGSIERTTEDIARFFDIPAEGTPFEIHLAAAALAVSGQAVAEVLGGTVIPESKPASANREYGSETQASVSTTGADNAPANDPWAQAESGEKGQPEKEAEPEKPRDDRQIMIDTIAGTGSVDGLKRLWAENKATFDADADLFEKWKARGRDLKK